MPHTSNVIKVVADTSFYVAGGLKNGYARNFLLKTQVTSPDYLLLTSPEILLELQQKLENLGLSRAAVVEYVNDVAQVATSLRPRQKLDVVRDPDDNKIIECAVEAAADLIVSFDKDLLDMKTYQGIAIAHPRMLKHWFK